MPPKSDPVYWLHISSHISSAHYSNANIREVSLLDALKSPLFMAYHDGQPFDGNNLLRPCPIYENTGKLAEMVAAAGAKSTDLERIADAK